MALKRETIWICDLCNKNEKVLSDDQKKGLNTPKGWDEREIRLMLKTSEYYERHVLMCDSCFEDFKGLYFNLEESKEPLKKSFWQKLFRGKDEV